MFQEVILNILLCIIIGFIGVCLFSCGYWILNKLVIQREVKRYIQRENMLNKKTAMYE